MLVIAAMRTEEHSLRSQVGIGSESACWLRQVKRNANSDVKVEKSGGEVGAGDAIVYVQYVTFIVG